MHASLRRSRVLFLLGVLVLAVGILLALDGLGFTPNRDERFFWPTTLYFRDRLPPTLEALRGYRDFMTPLAFLLFGLLERLFGGGIQVGRAVNLLLGLGVLAWMGLPRAGCQAARIKAAVGLLAFPYFLFCATHLYTDMLAASLALLGMQLHLGARRGWAAVAFVLAISTRQPMVAFPLALLLWEFGPERRHLPSLSRRLQPLALAASSLAGWFLVFGGVSPPAAVAAQHVATVAPLRFMPHHALYTLACVGAWFVAVELALFPEARARMRAVPRSTLLTWALVLLGLFLLFPPLGNIERRVVAMGALDRLLRAALPDVGRVAVLWGLALLAGVGVAARPLSLAGCLVLVHAAVLMKAPAAWDKYTLALMVALWALRAEARRSRPPCGGVSGPPTPGR